MRNVLRHFLWNPKTLVFTYRMNILLLSLTAYRLLKSIQLCSVQSSLDLSVHIALCCLCVTSIWPADTHQSCWGLPQYFADEMEIILKSMWARLWVKYDGCMGFNSRTKYTQRYPLWYSHLIAYPSNRNNVSNQMVNINFFNFIFFPAIEVNGLWIHTKERFIVVNLIEVLAKRKKGAAT